MSDHLEHRSCNAEHMKDTLDLQRPRPSCMECCPRRDSRSTQPHVVSLSHALDTTSATCGFMRMPEQRSPRDRLIRWHTPWDETWCSESDSMRLVQQPDNNYWRMNRR